MTLLLDHFLVITKPGAPVANQLVTMGLKEGSPNSHVGQGTSNRRFYLGKSMFEFLYISDANEAKHGAGKDLCFLERAQAPNASPFGLVARVESAQTIPSFPSWLYFPDYFDGKLSFYVGNNSSVLEEPLCICMPPALPKQSGIPSEFANPNWIITSIEICMPVDRPSVPCQHFAALDSVKFTYNEPHRMNLTIKHGASNQFIDFGPEIPVCMNW